MSVISPLVSVIVAAYNESNCILRCLKSISDQTINNFEIIVVDDGSNDNTVAICEEYAKREPRLRLLEKRNGGVSSARNAGLEAARGKYVYFADADDFLLKDCLELLVSGARNQSADVVVGEYFISEGGHKSLVSQVPFNDSRELLGTLLSGRNHSGLWNKLFRRYLFDEIRFDENVCYLEDRLLICEILFKFQPTVALIESPLYIYSVNPLSASNSGGAVLMQALEAHDKISLMLIRYGAGNIITKVHLDSGYRIAWYLFRNIRSEFLDEALVKLDNFVCGLRYKGLKRPKIYPYVLLDIVLKCPRPIRHGFAMSLRSFIFLVAGVIGRI